jgi:hypothetical protein
MLLPPPLITILGIWPRLLGEIDSVNAMISGKTESLQTGSNYMNTRPVHSFLLPALAVVGLIPAGRVTAQTLH